MGTLYVDSGGSLTNSGSTDTSAATATGTAATVASTTVTLDGSPSLSGLSTSGANQSTIWLSQATNSNLKIFWITGFDDTLKTVTVSVAPTGVTSSAWSIGGRCATPNLPLSAARAGDTVLVNNDITVTGSIPATFRNAGSSAGFTALKGKLNGSTRPKITVTDTNAVVNCNSLASGILVQDLELIQQGATGNVLANLFGGTIKNVKISDGGGAGISVATALGAAIIDCEISGVGTDGIACNSAGTFLLVDGCNIHDCGQDGISDASVNMHLMVLNSTIHNNVRDGINITAAPTTQTHLKHLNGNTIVDNGRDNIRTVDADVRMRLRNNIVKDGVVNNVNFSAGTIEATGSHDHNVFSQTRGGATNLVGVTADATDLTSDPLFTSQAGKDFSLQSGSPAKGAGFPGQLVGGSLSSRDIGAVQRVEPAAGSRRRTTSILSRARGIGLT